MFEAVNEETIKRNKELVEEYPFLAPRFDGKIDPFYNYSFTYLDDMPAGWHKAFGEDLCKDLKGALIKEGRLDDYCVLQVKEKFGGLRWYGSFEPTSVSDVIDKYERLSERTCVSCGAPATRISTGWICPFCDSCAEEINGRTVPIEEYYSDEVDS